MRAFRTISSYLIILFVIGLGLAACTYETVIPEVEPITDTVSFNDEIIPIFDASCNFQGCHNTNGIPPDLTADRAWVNLTFGGYVDTADAESSLLYTKIAPGGSMEQYSTPQETAIILAWIEQGAQNN